MLKRKPAANFPLLKVGHSKLDEVKVEPVDDLISQLQQANAQVVADLNRQSSRSELGRCCQYGCCCEPCRMGAYGVCTIDAMTATGASPAEIREQKERGYERYQYDRNEDRGRDYGRDYSRERDYRGSPMREEERAFALAHREWTDRYGGSWDVLNNRPRFQSYEDQYRWESILRGYHARAKSEAQEEYMARMRYLNDLRQSETMDFTLDRRDPMGWLIFDDKKGKK